MPYIVKRSDGAVWSRCLDHPGHCWYKNQVPTTYKTEQEAERVRQHVKNFRTNGCVVTVEEYP